MTVQKMRSRSARSMLIASTCTLWFRPTTSYQFGLPPSLTTSWKSSSETPFWWITTWFESVRVMRYSRSSRVKYTSPATSPGNDGIGSRYCMPLIVGGGPA